MTFCELELFKQDHAGGCTQCEPTMMLSFGLWTTVLKHHIWLFLLFCLVPEVAMFG